jgi:hypothetical protein
MGYGNQPWKDSLETISWQDFEQEDGLIVFWGNETTIFLNDEVASSRVDDSQTGFKGRRNPPKQQFGSKSCMEMQSRQEANTRGFKGGYEIMSRSITFGSSIANSYAQSSNVSSEQGTLNNDVNSVLTASNS